VAVSRLGGRTMWEAGHGYVYEGMGYGRVVNGPAYWVHRSAGAFGARTGWPHLFGVLEVPGITPLV